jgi:1-acyl-sn-glycerol-3-phosphate acyltransferase
MLERAWRTLATAFCFASFGLGGVLIGLIGFLGIRVVVSDAALRSRRARAFVHFAFRLFVWMMCTLRVLSVEVRGQDRLGREGLLVLANHPSLIDVVFLLSILPQANCVVKSHLLRNPFTRGPVEAAGYITNDQGEALISDCVATLKCGETLLLFPEGTRTRPGEPIRLLRGAAHIAVRARAPITPVVIRVNTPVLHKGAKWLRVPPRRPHFIIEAKDDIGVDEYIVRRRSLPLAARDLTMSLQSYFAAEVGQIASA